MQRQNQTDRILAALALFMAFTPAALAQTGGQPRPATGRIAVVDVVKIFNEYLLQKDLTDEINKKKAELQLEAQARRERADAMKATLDALNPSDPTYPAKMNELIQMQIQNKNWVEIKEAAMTAEIAKWSANIYKEILKATEEVAVQSGYDLVLYREEFEPVNPDPDAVRQQIRSRKVVYVNPSIDISQIVLDKLNTAHRAAPAKERLYIP